MKTKNILLFFLLASIAYKFFFIFYSYPYLLHPDEPYLLKDPLKLLLLYKNGDFSTSTNLYFWLSGFYTGFVFVVGKLFHCWGSLAEFQDLILSDNINIYVAGRVLSIVFATIGNILFLNYISKFVKDKTLFLLFALTFLFNPIEIYANNWIKFDPFCYLYFALLVNLAHSYFNTDGRFAKKYFYSFLFASLAVRIDFMVFLAAAAGFDWYKNGLRQAFVSNVKPLLIGMLLYSAFTLYPLTLIYNYLHPVSAATENIKVAKPFEAVILKRFLNDSLYDIFMAAARNLKFYLVDCLLFGLGPLILLFVFTRLKSNFREAGFLYLFILPLFGFLLISSAAMPHYSLLISVSVLLLSFISLNHLTNKKLKYSLAVFNLLFVLSIALQNLWIAQRTDPRILAKDHLLKNTKPDELLAIDKFSMPGFYPPVLECSGALKKKAELVSKYKEGTGESFRVRSGMPDTDCRPILEIFDHDPYARDPVYKGYFINTYDAPSFREKNSRVFVTPFNLAEHKDKKHEAFYSYIVKNYDLKQSFTQEIPDPRMQNIYPFLTTLFIYEKKAP